jgi:hypothetical protein
MSLRAYRQITPPVLADEPSFGLWHEEKIFESLLKLDGTWSSDGNEEIEVYVEELEELLKSTQFNPDIVQALQKDIHIAKAKKDVCLYYHII